MGRKLNVLSNGVHVEVDNKKEYFNNGFITLSDDVYGILDYFNIRNIKLELVGEEITEDFFENIKRNIKVNVISEDNIVEVCGSNYVKIIKQKDQNGDVHFCTSSFPIICSKMRDKYLRWDNDNNALPQELKFTLEYEKNGEKYEIESDKCKFIIYERNSSVGNIFHTVYIPSYYRPFYSNTVLLLFPENFNIEATTSSTKFYEKMTDQKITATSVSDSKKCHGRLFYSIANGITNKENFIENNRSGDKYILDSVLFDYNQGEHSMKLLQPCRGYDEMEVYEKDTTLYNIMGYGITEPLSIKEHNVLNVSIVRHGIPVGLKMNNNERKIECYINRTINKINDESYENSSPYPLLQHMGGYNGDEVFFNTTTEMSFGVSINDYSPKGYYSANIFSGYNGVVFYSSIKRDEEGKLNVEGYSSDGARYYLINDKKLESLLYSVYGFHAKDYYGLTSFKGVHTNDYIINEKKDINDGGWQGLHTVLLNGTNETIVDITDTLSHSFNTQSSSKEGYDKNCNFVIGIYDKYTLLSEEYLNKEIETPFSVLKKHNNRFSIIKFYKL